MTQHDSSPAATSRRDALRGVAALATTLTGGVLVGFRMASSTGDNAPGAVPVNWADPPSGSDDTAAVNRAIDALPNDGRATLHLHAGTYRFRAPLRIPSGAALRGQGASATSLNYSGTATFIDLQERADVGLFDLQIKGEAPEFTLVRVTNSFHCDLGHVHFQGGHHSDSADARPAQIGVVIDGNAGDNTFQGCRFANLGVGVSTAAIQNYLTSCAFSRCERSIWGTAGSHDSGMSASSCSFVGTEQSTLSHVQIDVAANLWWFSHCWLEGAQNTVVVGSEAGGPYAFGMNNCKIAGSRNCLVINAARQTSLTNLAFGADPGHQPQELVIDPRGAVEGVAVNCVTTQGYDWPEQTFPPYWTVLGRGQITSPAMVSVSDGVQVVEGRRVAAGLMRDGTISTRKGIALENTSAIPADMSNGGAIFVQDGALKYRGASGTITTLAQS